MSSNNTIELILSGDSSKLNSALGTGERRVKSFGTKVKHEFDAIRRAAGSVQGTLAGLGVSIGAAMLVKQSAQLDKSLTQIGQTAGESREKVTGLRKELFEMAKESGESVDDLKQGFNNAVQAGLNFKEALPVLKATNKAMAVTGANANTLTAGLTVAATAFEFDLSKPNMALSLLDKMTVAGRSGNAELENLSDIFSRVGVNAQRSGMGFDQTLAFIEGLSLIERQPERLATLADSTLRLFTNLNYMKQAQKSTGVKFFDETGERRNPLDILTDIYKKYDALKTTKEKELFLGTALKSADQDTIKGLQTLLKGQMLSKISGEFARKIAEAGGTLDRDMADAMNNAVSQTGRLTAEMRRAADAFIQPLNTGITAVIKKLLDPRIKKESWAMDYDDPNFNPNEKGGWGLSGKQLLGGGAAALAGSYAAYRFGGPFARKLLGRLGGTAAGIAEGKAVQAATGVTPVFVTNWPSNIGGLGGGGTPLPGSLNKVPKGNIGKIARIAGKASLWGSTFLASYEISKGVFEMTGLDKGLERMGAKLFDAIQGIKSTFNINIDQSGRPTVSTSSGSEPPKININRGKQGR